eukprot:scaffold74576_cov21-Tisochrysis_lutea.AAC.2
MMSVQDPNGLMSSDSSKLHTKHALQSVLEQMQTLSLARVPEMLQEIDTKHAVTFTCACSTGLLQEGNTKHAVISTCACSTGLLQETDTKHIVTSTCACTTDLLQGSDTKHAVSGVRIWVHVADPTRWLLGGVGSSELLEEAAARGRSIDGWVTVTRRKHWPGASGGAPCMCLLWPRTSYSACASVKVNSPYLEEAAAKCAECTPHGVLLVYVYMRVCVCACMCVWSHCVCGYSAKFGVQGETSSILFFPDRTGPGRRNGHHCFFAFLLKNVGSTITPKLLHSCRVCGLGVHFRALIFSFSTQFHVGRKRLCILSGPSTQKCKTLSPHNCSPSAGEVCPCFPTPWQQALSA